MDKIIYSTVENAYAEYEKRSPSAYTRKSITGKIVGSNKCVGYCMFYGHPGFLTKEQRAQHDCLNKECFYYVAKSKKRSPSSADRNDFSSFFSDSIGVSKR